MPSRYSDPPNKEPENQVEAKSSEGKQEPAETVIQWHQPSAPQKVNNPTPPIDVREWVPESTQATAATEPEKSVAGKEEKKTRWLQAEFVKSEEQRKQEIPLATGDETTIQSHLAPNLLIVQHLSLDKPDFYPIPDHEDDAGAMVEAFSKKRWAWRKELRNLTPGFNPLSMEKDLAILYDKSGDRRDTNFLVRIFRRPDVCADVTKFPVRVEFIYLLVCVLAMALVSIIVLAYPITK
jgi:hypothetical protein